LAIPVIVWVEAPVKRTKDTSPKFTLLEVPVVEKSLPFLKATEEVTSKSAPNEVLPPLTVNVLVPATVVLPVRLIPPLPDWIKVCELPDTFPSTTADALPLPMDTVPFVPVELPTSIDMFPEAKTPLVTLPLVMLTSEVAAPARLAVERLVVLKPCRLSVPLVVVRLLLVLPVKEIAPPVTVRPALPVKRLVKVLAPAQVWVPVETRPGKDASAVWRIKELPTMTAPSALLVCESIVPTALTPDPEVLIRHKLAPES
jgi:hypothetical protein